MRNAHRVRESVLKRCWNPPVTVPNSPVFALRPMTNADSELAYAITREAMRADVEQTWGPWIEAEQRERHARSFRAGQHDFIVVTGIELGLRVLEWRPGCVYLARLYLRTAAQGQGIGAAVLQDLLAQARAVGRGVELQVLKANIGARGFYAGHGFERVGGAKAINPTSASAGARGHDRVWLLRRMSGSERAYAGHGQA
jgi:GNAT superfamily N-acetyltransferase